MRPILLLFLLAAVPPAFSCTLFKVTEGGRTIVGNNEDAWSVNAQIRFENGGAGEFGAVYFAHFNGQPMGSMADQGGMNTAGLMYDALVVEPKQVPRATGKPSTDYQHLMHRVMRTCADAHQAKRLIATYDLSWLYHSMIVLVDRNGDYLVVESDTLHTGSDPTYAAGNFRPSACTDLNAVPIARYQKGRTLLATGADTSLAYSTAVADSMRACRNFLGNGTLYTDLLELDKGIIHLFFYHDFTHQRTFHLKAELAKGDHTIEMASLFPPNAEYEKLLAYKTPFHDRGIFYGLVALLCLAGMIGLWSAYLLIRSLLRRMRGSSKPTGLWRPLATALSSAIAVVLLPVLLIKEEVFYFSLGDATDGISPLLKFLPLVFFALMAPLLLAVRREWHSKGGGTPLKWMYRVHAAMGAVLVIGFAYWGLLVP